MFGGAMVLLLIRFGVGAWIKKVTVHRGMIHSIPMAILVGEITFFAVTGTVEVRILKAAALTMGYLSHLVLDEIYSIDSTGEKLRLKKSFGTALKWTNPKQRGPVTIIYALIFFLGCAALSNPDVIEWRNGNVVVADKPSSSFWQKLSGGANNTIQTQDCEVQREAVEFLAQLAPMTAQPYSEHVRVPEPAELLPLGPASELPAAMQIENDWNRNAPIQPARISLQ